MEAGRLTDSVSLAGRQVRCRQAGRQVRCGLAGWQVRCRLAGWQVRCRLASWQVGCRLAGWLAGSMQVGWQAGSMQAGYQVGCGLARCRQLAASMSLAGRCDAGRRADRLAGWLAGLNALTAWLLSSLTAVEPDCLIAVRVSGTPHFSSLLCPILSAPRVGTIWKGRYARRPVM
jgi:hypothetical protein